MLRVVVLFLVGAAVAGLIVAGPKLASVADKVNLIGMLDKIYQSTSSIEEVNTSTVGELGDIVQKSGQAASVGQKLDLMKDLLAKQIDRLESLRVTTEKQIQLSNSLQAQSLELESLLHSIGESSATLNSYMTALNSVSQSMAGGMGKIVSQNRTVAGKLQQVAELTREVDQSIP